MTANRDISSLHDILQAASLIQEFVAGKDIEQLENDKMCYSAVIRQLEIIGEAANRVSKEFQAAHIGTLVGYCPQRGTLIPAALRIGRKSNKQNDQCQQQETKAPL